jgi:hypothetical protein
MGRTAQAQQHSADVAVTYTAERAKVVGSGCGCFWLQGGSVDGALTFYHGWGVAGNLTGDHASNIGPGVDLSKVSYMAGPRYTSNLHRWTSRHHAPRVFGEALFGGAHAFDSVFPAGAGTKASANAFSMQAGGGVDVGFAKGFSVRALELDYVRTNLPDNGSDYQNHLRLAFGVSYHFQRH